MKREQAIEWLRENLKEWPSNAAPAVPPPNGWGWAIDRPSGRFTLDEPRGASSPITQTDVVADGAFLYGRYFRPGDLVSFQPENGERLVGSFEAESAAGRVWFDGCKTGSWMPVGAKVLHRSQLEYVRPAGREEFIRQACEVASADALVRRQSVSETVRVLAGELYDAGARFPGQEA